MSKLSDLTTDYLNVLVIGEWGTGKTTFASTFPDPIYWFDYDMGLVGIRNCGKQVDYDTMIDDDLSRPTVANQTEAKVNELLKECPYKTVVFDTTTNLADAFMSRILKQNNRHTQPPQLQDYYKLTSDFKQLVYRAKALPCHTIFIAHEFISEDKDSGKTRSMPLLTSKLAARLGGMFNEVYYTDVASTKDGLEFRLLTRIKGIRKGKTQLGKGIFDEFESPDFGHLITKLQGIKGGQ